MYEQFVKFPFRNLNTKTISKFTEIEEIVSPYLHLPLMPCKKKTLCDRPKYVKSAIFGQSRGQSQREFV